MQGPEALVAGVRIPIDASPRGAGYVELPNDANPSDNVFHFSYSPPQRIVATVVAEEDSIRDLLGLALATPYSDQDDVECNALRPDQFAQVDWTRSSLVCWQGELGNEATQAAMESFVKRGGTLVLFPPMDKANAVGSPPAKLLGITWGSWQQSEVPMTVSNWRTDSDLCRNTESSESIPLNELRMAKVIGLDAEDFVSLATLSKASSGETIASSSPSMSTNPNFLSRQRRGEGVVFVFHTLPEDDYSNLAQDGVCLYIMLQRALHDGLTGPSTGVVFEAGASLPSDLQEWQAANEATKTTLPWERPYQSGAYQNEERIITVNRSHDEDTAPLMTESQWQNVLSETRVSTFLDDPSTDRSLVREIWRAFIVMMIVGLLGEAILSLPSRRLARSEIQNPMRGAFAAERGNAA
jgi:hypothetical protein